MELWTSLVSPADSKDPRRIAERAQRLESDGWAGAIFADSQIMAPEAYTLLTWCASATERLKLGTGTSNPATRHPSVIASAAVLLQVVSEGRMTLSVGRGDSSLAYIGVPPVPLGYYEKSLAMIQAYLRGEAVPTEEAARFLGDLDRGFDTLSVAATPKTAGLAWIPDSYVKPELEAAASGPKVIAIAARHADRIGLALGADIERLKWAIGLARAEAERIGRDPATLSFSAYIPCYPHRDHQYARELAQGMVTSMSRFSVMHKKVEGPVTKTDRDNLERVAASYDMRSHGSSHSEHSQMLDPDFIDKFALVGDPDACVDRMRAIGDLGVDRLILWTAETYGKAGESYNMAVEKLLPAF